MKRHLTAADLADAVRPCMNPASIIWPEWPRDPVEGAAVLRAMKPRRRRDDDRPLVFVNPELLRS